MMMSVICAFNSVSSMAELKDMLSSLGIHSGVWKAVWFSVVVVVVDDDVVLVF